MTITQNQRKLFWIAAILATVYFAPSIATFLWQAVMPLPPMTSSAGPAARPALWQPGRAVMAAQTEPPAAPKALTLPSITGVWGNTTTLRPGTTATYRIELTQTGNAITGRSRREINNPDGSTYVVYSITGTSIDSGTAFTFQEGKLLESYPPMQSWCPVRTMTLVPTADGMLVGSVDAPPCGPGTMLLKKVK